MKNSSTKKQIPGPDRINAYSIYSNIENLVLGARSEMVGSAINQICCWFQVSGFRCQ